MTHTVILVSEAPQQLVEAFHMRWAPDPDKALAMAFDLVGQDASVIAVPDAVSTLIKETTE